MLSKAGSDQLMNRHLIIYFSLFILSACDPRTSLDLSGYILETEPNEMTFQAMEVESGKLYAAVLETKKDGTADTDLFKIWRPAGTEITIEIESAKEDFFPYIGHGDNLGHAQFVTFPSAGRHRAVFVTSVDGWQYFETGDVRNTDETGGVFGGYYYYFRISSRSVCDSGIYEILSPGQELERNFDRSLSGSDIVELDIPDNGIYQIRVQSGTVESDKTTFIFNCDSGESAAGNDDEDYNSNLMNPLIYSRFESGLKYLAVTGRLLTELDSRGPDDFTLTLLRQPSDSELEPNNLYNYANITDTQNVSGRLSEKPQIILGETADDQDWFRYDLQKGRIAEMVIVTEAGKNITAEFWAGTYPVTGSTVIPLRFSSLKGLETHYVNMLMPFTGTAYLNLTGKDENYSFSVSDAGEPEVLVQFNDTVHKMIEMPDCRWAFYEWNMPDNGDLFEIEVSGDVPAGIHIFSSDLLPYAFIDPAGVSRAFIRRYEKTQTIYLGIYQGECEQDSGSVTHLRTSPVHTDIREWSGGLSPDPVKAGQGSYSGHFDTDNYFVENNFEIMIENDGTMYVSTSPDRRNTDFNIDTVIRVFRKEELMAENDDMIDILNYNKYSRTVLDVKKGEKYIIQVKPFMTESSHIPSMNITGNYILDIIIK